MSLESDNWKIACGVTRYNRVATLDATWNLTAMRWYRVGALEKDNCELGLWRDAPLSGRKDQDFIGNVGNISQLSDTDQRKLNPLELGMLVHGKMLWKLKAMTKVPCFGLGAFMMLVDARQASKGDASSFLHYRETALVFIKLVIVIKQLKLLNCDSALVPPQPGEKVVNYPTRPVDTTTDFEGTISLQPSQPALLTAKLLVLPDDPMWHGDLEQLAACFSCSTPTSHVEEEKELELVNHLLFYCGTFKQSWELYLNLCGVVRSLFLKLKQFVNVPRGIEPSVFRSIGYLVMAEDCKDPQAVLEDHPIMHFLASRESRRPFNSVWTTISRAQVSSGNAASGGMHGPHVMPTRSVPRPMQMVNMQRMQPQGMSAYNLASQAGMGAGMNPVNMPMQRGGAAQMRRKDPGMGMPGYPPQQKSRRF
ncbi:Cyclin-dependent kinase E-1 [Capsicum annuum]|nr:Cyclin-dependent kinase E-1 [Capsicum annuum]